jgi:outer membrane protein OmpA-like peptidoglycan-associated protein
MSIFSDVTHEEQWISVSDLMSALMMIFLLLSLFYMVSIIDQDEADEASVYQELMGENQTLMKQNEKLQAKVNQVVSQFFVVQKRSDQLVAADKLLTELKGEDVTPADIPTIVREHKQLLNELKAENIEAPEIPTILKEYTNLMEELKGTNTTVAEIPTIVNEQKQLRDELKGRSLTPTEIAAIVTEHTELADKLKGEKVDVKQVPTIVSEYKTIKELMADQKAPIVTLVKKHTELAEELEQAKKKLEGMNETHEFLQDLSLENIEKPDIPALVAYTKMLKELRNANVKTPEIPAIVVEHQKMLDEMKGENVKPPEIPTIVKDYKKLQEELKGRNLKPVEIASIVNDYEKLREELKTQEVEVSQVPRILSEYKILEDTLDAKDAANVVATLKRKNEEVEELKSQLKSTLTQAVVYDNAVKDLQQSLLVEFNSDLKKWNAELREDLTLRFNEPEVLFEAGKAEIKPRFKEILNEFFPRYLKLIMGKEYKDAVAEIRVEGHTSSDWIGLNPNSKEAYFRNMVLSQERARNTLFYIMDNVPTVKNNYSWLKSRMTANGLSSSRLVDKHGVLLTSKDSTGKEDRRLSRRVEFRVKLKQGSDIAKKLENADANNPDNPNLK